jgi:transposase-like protein
MNKKQEKLLTELIDQIDSPEDFYKIKDQLFKRGVESLLNSELTAHLQESKNKESEKNIRNGYSSKTLKTGTGEHTIKVPRDRQSTFDPVIVPKHKTMAGELEDCILLLYAKGMSNADIVDFVHTTYGVKYSTSQVSIITDSLLDDIREWQNRPLEDKYAILWIDAIHYKIRQDGKVISKAAMIVLGINLEGQQDILSIHIVEKESASSWMQILDDLKGRGVDDILFLCSDNLTGITKAVEAVFPKSIHQICIVHQIRNSLKFVSYKDRRSIIKDIKHIYQSTNLENAQKAFADFKAKWKDKYEPAVKSWEKNWDQLTVFLSYPVEIRKLIYTTNIIESFNASLRKFTKNKKIFPTDDAALKSIYLAAHQIRKKWQKGRFNWHKVYNQLYIHFENRIV